MAARVGGADPAWRGTAPTAGDGPRVPQLTVPGEPPIGHSWGTYHHERNGQTSKHGDVMDRWVGRGFGVPRRTSSCGHIASTGSRKKMCRSACMQYRVNKCFTEND